MIFLLDRSNDKNINRVMNLGGVDKPNYRKPISEGNEIGSGVDRGTSGNVKRQFRNEYFLKYS